MLSKMVRREPLTWPQPLPLRSKLTGTYHQTPFSAPLKCPQCHAEKSDHELRKSTEMHFICKKVRSFRPAVDLVPVPFPSSSSSSSYSSIASRKRDPAPGTPKLTACHSCSLTTTQCKKAFRKDINQYEESDEYCPHCDNHYVSPPGLIAAAG